MNSVNQGQSRPSKLHRYPYVERGKISIQALDHLALRGSGRLARTPVFTVTSALTSINTKMHLLLSLVLAFGLDVVNAHGGGHGQGPAHGETIQQYAQRHVRL